jgi:hypothetical protein
MVDIFPFDFFQVRYLFFDLLYFDNLLFDILFFDIFVRHFALRHFDFRRFSSKSDFQVRFCCANNDFITTTSTTPRPIDSDTCGRAHIKPAVQFTRIFGGSRAIPHSWPWVSFNLKKKRKFDLFFSKFYMKRRNYVNRIRYV